MRTHDKGEGVGDLCILWKMTEDGIGNGRVSVCGVSARRAGEGV